MRLDCQNYDLYLGLEKILIHGNMEVVNYLHVHLTHIVCDYNSLLLLLIFFIIREDLFLIEFYAQPFFLFETSQIHQCTRSPMYRVAKLVESSAPLHLGYPFM